jgi:hypothetical protein
MSPQTLPGNEFCQYINHSCAECFTNPSKGSVLFLYPSNPVLTASTIEAASENLQKKHSGHTYKTWKQLKNEGKIVFCEICKAIFSSEFCICDITNLSFNVLFEIGYIIGLSKPFIPIFEKSYEKNKDLISQVGLLDTIGYKEYVNSGDILNFVESGCSALNVQRNVQIDTFRPIYYLKSPVDSDGSLRVTSILKKSHFQCRMYDSKEMYRLPLNRAVEEVDKSRAVLVHLLQEGRKEALVHNARSAFVAGLALAAQKHILIIQEGRFDNPIDYRDIVNEYETPAQIDAILEDFIKSVAISIQSPIKNVVSISRSKLEEIDIGDVAAENEIEKLRGYFVRTGEFNSSRKGHVQIVVGRKGSGKTALFYALRHNINPIRQDVVVLDLKPEGYQFAKLNENILKNITPAVRQHTLTALWDYILLLELTHKILKDKKEVIIATRDIDKSKAWSAIKDKYELHRSLEQGDFSERLNGLIDKIVERFPGIDLSKGAPAITELVFGQDIKELSDMVIDYLSDKEEVWLLFDNLDKNWTATKKNEYEISILKALLDAARKLQKMFVKNHVNFYSTVFIRSDIYSFFLQETTDRGKEHVAFLNWDDAHLFKVLFGLRIDNKARTEQELDKIWTDIFDLHVGSVSSFNYIVDRTLRRPRDFLLYVMYALQSAINHGQDRITSDDILKSEESYSRDLFTGLSYEMADIDPELKDILYSFLEVKSDLNETDVKKLLLQAKIPEAKLDNVIEKLLWFCFLGVYDSNLEERYAYSVGYDIQKLLKLSNWGEKDKTERVYRIHPGFRRVLEVKI